VLIQAEAHSSSAAPESSEMLKRDLRRRAAIKPELGHMTIRQKRSGWRIGPNPHSGLRPRRGEGGPRVRSDGLLGRNFLKGVIGDAQNVILCGYGHNMRKILAHLRALLRLLMGEPRKAIQALIALLEAEANPQQALMAA